MKKILSYLLLCVYAMIMIKPVMPTVADIFAHLLNYKDHIATVHKHNGKLHVHYEYMEAAKKDSGENNPYNNTSKKSGNADEHVLFDEFPLLSILKILSNHSLSPVHDLPSVSIHGNLRPPISILA